MINQLTKKYKLTDKQKKIIELQGKNILKSCPGSGKTFVVAHKVIHDFNNWEYKNKGMAILSFTNVAKNELDEKIRELSGLTSLPYPHFIGTLDSFISQFIFMPFYQTVMKCSSHPSIIEDDYIKEYSSYFWKRECYQNGCIPKEFYIDSEKNVYGIVEKYDNCPFIKNKPCIKFKNSLYSKGYVTYKEVLIMAIDILEKNANILKLIVNKFPCFIVDEAQDTSEEQMKLLNLLFDNGVRNALLIGDPDQAIYEWRDADPSVFLNLYNCKKWNSIELNENFRCSQPICNATKVFSSLTDISIAKGESKDSLLKPMLMKYKKDNKEEVIEKFLDLCRENNINISSNNVAVLVRGRSGLMGKDYSSIKELWKTPVTQLLAQATYYKGIKRVDKIVSNIEKVLYYLIFDNEPRTIDYKVVQTIYSISEWNMLVFRLSVIIPNSMVTLKEWKTSIVDICKKFIKNNNISCKYELDIKVKSRVKNDKLKDFLEQPMHVFFADFYEDDYLSTTIHAVKGRTFDAVMLILSTNGKLTTNMINQKSIDTEEIRTFYVAATRAKKLFVLAIPNTVKDKTLERLSKEYWDYVE